MNIKRLMGIPKSRILKKIIGYDEIYTIAIRKVKNDNWLFNSGKGLFHCIPYSDRFWYADPVSFLWKGKTYLFAEAFDRKEKKGHIVAAEINRDIYNIVFRPIIKESYHMSFPMVFEWKGFVYMIPETSENKSINLYRAIEFPYVWKLESSFNVGYRLVDTVVINKEEELLLLASEINPGNPLEVRYRKYILGKKIDYYLIELEKKEYDKCYNLSERNAGRVFKYNGLSILPTQRSAKYDYGVYLGFKKIEKNNYSLIREIGPDEVVIKNIMTKDIIGIHTYSKFNDMEIIDLRYLKFSPINCWKKRFHLLSKSNS